MPSPAEWFPQHIKRSGVAAVTAAADRIAAQKQAIDEIRAYCGAVAATGTSSQVAVIGDVLKILQENGLT